MRNPGRMCLMARLRILGMALLAVTGGGCVSDHKEVLRDAAQATLIDAVDGTDGPRQARMQQGPAPLPTPAPMPAQPIGPPPAVPTGQPSSKPSDPPPPLPRQTQTPAQPIGPPPLGPAQPASF